jgi:hypothetical protein
MGDSIYPSREQIRRMPYLGHIITESMLRTNHSPSLPTHLSTTHQN